MKFSVLSFVSVIFLLTAGSIVAYSDGLVIEKGRKVTFDYTLTVDGKIIDSSTGQHPIKYIDGEGTIIPGLARELEGLHVGDEKSIVIAPQDAYGVIDQNAFREVPKSSLPPNLSPEVGMMLEMKGSDGRSFPVVISAVKNDTITLNFNHPLAGKELHFQVKITDIQ